MKNLLYFISFFFLCIFSIHTTTSQVSQSWVNHVDGIMQHDFSAGLCVDNSGNSYITGYIDTEPSQLYPIYDFITAKYDNNGTLQWTATFNGAANGSDFAQGVVVDNSGNVYVTGVGLNNINKGDDIVTIKYNSSGQQQWMASYNGDYYMNQGREIAIDNNGYIYVAGITCRNPEEFNCIVLKYDQNGNLLWNTQYTSSRIANNYPYDMTINSGGDVIVTGFTGPNGNLDFFTFAVNPSGAILWSVLYNSGNEDYSNAVCTDNNNNVYVTGQSLDPANDWNYTTIKYDSFGNQQWLQTYDHFSLEDVPLDIVCDYNSNVFITGRSIGDGTGYDAATLKYTTSGTLQWVRRYNGTGTNSFDEGKALKSDFNGNVYVTGGVVNNGNSDAFTVSYDSDGNTVWDITYDRSGSDDFSGFIDLFYSPFNITDPQVFIAGHSFSQTTKYDLTIIKYEQSTSDMILRKAAENTVPGSFSLEQNYPNPFNPSTTIKYSVPVSGNVSIKVYNSIGVEVMTVVNKNHVAGNYIENVDLSGLSSGIYFYTLTSGDFKDTKKMMLVK